MTVRADPTRPISLPEEPSFPMCSAMPCEELDGKGETHVERHCDNCEHPNSSLLRVVLIGEIIRADEPDLYMLAEVFDELGLLDLSDEDEPPSEDPPTPRTLHRIK